MTADISASRWERILVNHYLDREGPWGAGEVRYIDASLEQLARALEMQGGLAVSPDEARRCFVRVFDASELDRVFNRGDAPRSTDPELPGYFRHLILTCMISAIDEEIGTNNFRVRFGQEVLGPGQKIGHLQYLPDLWRKLVCWIERRNAVGQHLRLLNLPDPAPWRKIGYSLKLAFPSWRDRHAMRKMISGAGIRNPRALIDRLEYRIAKYGGSGSLQAAYDDFRARYRRGERMLQRHPFWLLTRELLDEDAGADGEPLIEPLIVELREGLDGDIEFFLRSAGAETPICVGNFSTIRSRLDADLPTRLRGPAERLKALLSRGWIILERSGLGVWASDDAVRPRDMIRILASAAQRRKWAHIFTFTSLIDIDWAVSEAVNPADVAVASIIGARVANEDDLVRPVELFGGIRVGRGAYLGRVGTLPLIRAPEDAEIRLQPVDPEASATARIVAGCTAAEFEIVADQPLDGNWDLTIREKTSRGIQGFEEARGLRFEPFASIHEVLAESSGQDQDAEPETIESPDGAGRGFSGLRHGVLAPASCTVDARMYDIAEMIYAKGRSQISEYDLLPALYRIVGDRGPSAWDVLRGFQEAGWLDVRRTRGWGTRAWFLRPPLLVRVAGRNVVVDGAMPHKWVEHLRIACRSAGAELEERPSPSPWAPPLFVLADDDKAVAVANKLGCCMLQPIWPMLPPAPDCWPSSKYTTSGRRPASEWSWTLGRFVTPQAAASTPEPVGLVRWIRDRGDSPAIYVVSDRSGRDLVTESRTAAIIEAHRRAHRPLFDFDGFRLNRISNDGFLPLSLVRALRWSALCDGGPMNGPDRRFGYFYRVPAEIIRQLRSIFGAVIDDDVRTDDDHKRARALAARRSPAARYVRRRPNFL